MELIKGASYAFESLIQSLIDDGYQRLPIVLSPGDFSVRGDIIDLFAVNQNAPIRLEFFGDDLEDIRTFEPATQRSISRLTSTRIEPVGDERLRHAHSIPHEILFDLHEGDAVVHIHHGVGRYTGLSRLKLHDFEGEYAVIEYQHGDKIYVPIEQLTRIYKYTGGVSPVINSLRDKKWEQTRAKVKKAVKNVAKDLFFLYKERKVKRGFSFLEDTEYDLALEQSFPFQETEDQLKAIQAVKRDMESDHPMDRLICGDVGFGKTEVAIRAAFKAVMAKKQVVILTPTTLLSKQHYRVMSKRMADFGVNVEFINRFKTRKQQQIILEQLEKGLIDIIVGTHRLLQKDVRFGNLGLLIIDEEQRFGVMAKERIKQLRTHIDVLTLSATPLPRTLYLSISGIRDISVINTPPLHRRPVITEVHPFDMSFIQSRIEVERARGGQVFILHNRIHDMIHLQQKLKALMPDLDCRIAHGQMNAHELEDLMMDFYDNVFSVLLSTTIIENGIDIPNVHTMMIDEADKFGLAQLHQLRGRVGRDEVQSYTYLLYKDSAILRQVAQDRFDALIEFSTLGSGYDIALRDLELRGIGNILGVEQSGYMQAIGLDLYMHLLNTALSHERGQPVPGEAPGFQLSTKTEAFVSEEYVPDMNIRLSVYKKIAELKTVSAVQSLLAECRDRFGPPPEQLVRMLSIIERSFQTR